MMRMGIAGLLAVSIALLATLAWELDGVALPARPTAARSLSAPAPATPASVPDHTPEWVATILARPLFNPDRRPAAQVVTARGAHMPDGLPRLSGIMVGPFGRSAIFIPEGRKPLVVNEGGRIDAWTIQAIEVGEVRISGPGGTRTLQPTFLTSPAPARPPGDHRVGLSLAR